MSVGESNLHANAILNLMRGMNATGFTPWVQLHLGDPGAAGTANPATTTTRKQVTFPAPTTGGTMVAPAVTWTNWQSSNSEVISHLSVWDAETSGNFRKSLQLDSAKTVEKFDDLQVTVTASQGPVAA